MNEELWLSSVDPAHMLQHLSRWDGWPLSRNQRKVRLSDRKLRLWYWQLALVRYTAVGRADALAKISPWEDGRPEENEKPGECWTFNGWHHWHEGDMPEAQKCHLLREIAGNPFRAIRLPIAWERATPSKYAGGWRDCCPWLTSDVLSLAEAAYQYRPVRKCEKCQWPGVQIREGYSAVDAVIAWGKQKARCPDCQGTGVLPGAALDPLALAALADALEEAGCQEEVILRHLRGEEYYVLEFVDDTHLGYGTPKFHMTKWRPLSVPHVRGCWVVDMLLSKE